MSESVAAATTRYRWRLLRGGEFRLDGGSMFGLVPRVVWSKSVATDDRGRITVQQNCLLLESVDGPKRLVLIEAGIGDKLDSKSRDIYGMGDRSVLDALREVQCATGDISAVVVSHLHFDHAGGLTRVVRPGETADWKPANERQGGPVKLSFPGAKVYAQQREWSDAMANRSVMTRTYFRDHLEPICDQFVGLDSPRPFAIGTIPDRDAIPAVPVDLRLREIAPGMGICVFVVPGHTWGQQATLFRDDKGRTVVFTPDVMPTAAHVGAAYSLAYDVEPYTSMVSRGWFLAEAADRDWLLVLDHEPGQPCRRVRRNQHGWFDLIEDAP